MTMFQKEEGNVAKKYLADGIFESMSGVGLLMLGLLFNTPFIMLFLIPFLLIFPLKNKISTPRIGYFKPLFIFSWKVFFPWLLGTAIGNAVFEKANGYTLGILFFVVFVMTVIARDIGYGFYMIVMALLCIATELVKISYSYVFIGFGIIMIVLGLRTLVLFIRNNPIIPNEE